MHNQNSVSRYGMKPLAALLAMALMTAALFFALPANAQALTVEKCSAQPTSSANNDVEGATETRITWEAMMEKGEGVKQISLTVPEGTSFGTDDAKLTLLTGKDLMDRSYPKSSVSSNGETITIDFADALNEEGLLRFTLYEVKFPAAGGEMQVAGTYTTADGATQDMKDIPSITVASKKTSDQIADWLNAQGWVQSWNKVKFLHLFLNPAIFVTSVPVVVKGFLMALATVLVAFPLAIPVGFMLSLMRTSRRGIFRGLSSVYVNLVRGTPLFLQIYVAFFGLPLAGIHIPNYLMGVIVLALNSSAYLCEIFRAGIQSIPKGQFEAARSLGMTASQTMLNVIIPQTVRRVMPTMTSEFILLYKDTSLLAAVGTMEVVMYAKTIVAATGSITPYIVAAMFYLIVTLPLAKVVGNFERKLAMSDGGHVPPSAKEERAKRKAEKAEKKAALKVAEEEKVEEAVAKNDLSIIEEVQHG